MRTFLRMRNHMTRRLPDRFRNDEVRYADELVATFVRQYCPAGGVVFDPFAGFGTTLLVAESMGREAYGVEYDADRVAYIRSLMRHPERLVHGDSRQLAQMSLPRADFVMTSPPFMSRNDPDNPLTNYSTDDAEYAVYLRELQTVFRQVRDLMQPSAHAVVEVANLKGDDGVTTLAWDVGRALSEVLVFRGEVIVGWDRYGYGYDHSYCLVFGRPAEDG